jgi:hypothetical protein
VEFALLAISLLKKIPVWLRTVALGMRKRKFAKELALLAKVTKTKLIANLKQVAFGIRQ